MGAEGAGGTVDFSSAQSVVKVPLVLQLCCSWLKPARNHGRVGMPVVVDFLLAQTDLNSVATARTGRLRWSKKKDWSVRYIGCLMSSLDRWRPSSQAKERRRQGWLVAVAEGGNDRFKAGPDEKRLAQRRLRQALVLYGASM